MTHLSLITMLSGVWDRGPGTGVTPYTSTRGIHVYTVRVSNTNTPPLFYYRVIIHTACRRSQS